MPRSFNRYTGRLLCLYREAKTHLDDRVFLFAFSRRHLLSLYIIFPPSKNPLNSTLKRGNICFVPKADFDKNNRASFRIIYCGKAFLQARIVDADANTRDREEQEEEEVAKKGSTLSAFPSLGRPLMFNTRVKTYKNSNFLAVKITLKCGRTVFFKTNLGNYVSLPDTGPPT